MTSDEQEILDVLSDRVYVMVTLEQREINHKDENNYMTIKILEISKRMTREEIMDKHHYLDMMHYPAHYKTPSQYVDFWQAGMMVYCPYIPIMVASGPIKLNIIV